MAESITLHNYYLPEVNSPEIFVNEITEYVNNQDFAAISFYPFLKGQHTAEHFNQAFSFLHSKINKPIAFVETGHIAEDLNVAGMQLSIKGDPCEQQTYLQQLLLQANAKDDEFIIWWTHRDYDRLWQIFPPETKDLGLLWKDTGLLTGDGLERPAMHSWEFALGKR